VAGLFASPGSKNSTYGQKIALTAIHDEENNSTTRVTAKRAVLPILSKRFFYRPMRGPQVTQERDD
jgi:hypothetical protein